MASSSKVKIEDLTKSKSKSRINKAPATTLDSLWGTKREADETSEAPVAKKLKRSNAMIPKEEDKASEEEPKGRKKFLRDLQAIALKSFLKGEKWKEPSKQDKHTAKELVRSWFQEEFGVKMPFKGLSDCRHNKDPGFIPVGEEPCRTAGTSDRNKPMMFLMHSVQNWLIKWLQQKGVFSQQRALRLLEEYAPDEDTASPRSTQKSSQIVSSFDPEQHDVEIDLSKRALDRKTTKQRLPMMFYLHEHSGDSDSFRRAWRGLCQPGNEVAHLCGCGTNWLEDKFTSACVTGSHLKLVDKSSNLEHKNFHHVLSRAPTSAVYQKLVKYMRQCNPGENGDLVDGIL